MYQGSGCSDWRGAGAVATAVDCVLKDGREALREGRTVGDFAFGAMKDGTSEYLKALYQYYLWGVADVT